MLDTTPDGQAVPNARAFAKVRGAFAAKKLDASLADAVLTALGDAPTAAKLAPTVELVMDAATAAKLSAEETQEIILDALADPGATDARAFAELARAAISSAWQAKGDLDIPMPGRTNAQAGVSYDGGEGFRAKMIAGLSAKLSGKADTPMAREAAQMSVGEIVMACARAAGLRPRNVAEAVQMRGLLTTSDFGRILDGSLGNEAARRLAATPIAIERAARVIERPDYRPVNLLNASGTTMPMEVAEGAEIKSVTLTDEGEASVALRDFAGILGITKKALINDASAVGLLQDLAGRMAEGGRDRKRATLLEPFLANTGAGQTMRDGQPMFHASHGNLAATGTALSVASLGAARTVLERRKGPQGEPVAVTPRFLVVPPELRTTAEVLMAQIAAAKIGDVNPFAGSLEIIVEPGLTDPTAWYLAADPSTYDGLVLGFLEGQTAPQIESREAWNTLSIEWRLWWPMDAKFTGTAAWFKNPGAAA